MQNLEASLSVQDFEEPIFGQNFSRFCTLLADKLETGDRAFQSGKCERTIFQFLIHVLEKIDVSSAKPRPEIMAILKSLNRVVVIILNHHLLKGFHQVLLSKLVQHQKIIFGICNTDSEFFYVLLYHITNFIIFQGRMTDADTPSEIATLSATIWRTALTLRGEEIEAIIKYKTPRGEITDLKTNGFDKLFSRRDVDYFLKWCRDHERELNLMMNEKLVQHNVEWEQTEARGSAERDRLFISHLKARQLEREKRNKTIHEKIISKRDRINRIGNAVFSSEKEILLQHHFNEIDKCKHFSAKWDSLADSYYSEGGIVGPSIPPPFQKYKLDPTEGPYRMRKRIAIEPTFFDRYVGISVGEERHIPSSLDSKVAISFLSALKKRRFVFILYYHF